MRKRATLLRRRAESRLRKLRSDESGWSLPELMVFIALMGIVAAVLVSFLHSSQQNLERQAS